MFTISAFLAAGLLLSCQAKQGSKTDAEESAAVDSLIERCIPYRDTVLGQGTSVKYVVVDTVYTVKLTINRTDSLLDYRFDCSVPRGLVPSLMASFGDKLCLQRGTGQNYREYLIAYLKDGQMQVKHYEVALAVDLANDVVIFQDYDDLRRIVVENIQTDGKRTVTLPNKYTSTIVSTLR